MVPRCMSSTTSANLLHQLSQPRAELFDFVLFVRLRHIVLVTQPKYRYGKQDIMFAGGGEELIDIVSFV